MFSVWEALKNACLDCKSRFFLLFLYASCWSQHIWQRQKGCLQREGKLSPSEKAWGGEDGCPCRVGSTKIGVNLAVSSQSVPGWAHPNSSALLPCWCWVQFPSWVLHMVKRFCLSWGTKFKGRGDLHQMVTDPRKGCCKTALGALFCETNYLSFFVTVKLPYSLFLSLSHIYANWNLKRKSKWKEKWEIQPQ